MKYAHNSSYGLLAACQALSFVLCVYEQSEPLREVLSLNPLYR